MGIDSHLSTCVGTQSPKYLEMAQGHISLSHQKCPVSQQSNDYMAPTVNYKSEQLWTVCGRSQSVEVRMAPYCPVHRFQRSNRSKPQRACWRGTHRTVNSGCPVHHRTVRCAHHQQKHTTARKWLEAINTPQPAPSMASKFSEVPIQYKSNNIHSKAYFKDQILSKPQKSTQPLSDLREREFYVHLLLLLLGLLFSFPFLFI
jgi:hypothetical protein